MNRLFSFGGAYNFCFCFIYGGVFSSPTFSHCVWSRFEHSICISVKKKGRLIRIKIHSIRIKIHSISGHPISPIPLSEKPSPSLGILPWCSFRDAGELPATGWDLRSFSGCTEAVYSPWRITRALWGWRQQWQPAALSVWECHLYSGTCEGGSIARFLKQGRREY